MGKLNVKLKGDFKSFENGFECFLEGDFVILSGVNGGGKSQIIDIIRGRNSSSKKLTVPSEVFLDGARLEQNEIAYSSFKENIQIKEIQNTNPQDIVSSKKQVWIHYSRYTLQTDEHNRENFARVCCMAKKILIDKYGKEKFLKKSLTEEEVIAAIPDDFVWVEGDLFENTIGNIFKKFAIRVFNEEANAGRNTSELDVSKLGVPPWTELNNLFSEFGLEYRFRDKYVLGGAGGDLDHFPRLYSLTEDGNVDLGNFRNLTDLSDGEKAIISLTFASLNDANQKGSEVLLLDEFDATLNPSLIEIFFKVLDKYFVSKGVMVVVATHSPATISMAPDNARYYEVYKKRIGYPRVLEIDKYDYSELKSVYEYYITRIADQDARIKELTELDGLVKKQKGPLVITEGKTDWKYFLSALRYFHNKDEFLDVKEEFFLKFGSYEDESSGICGTNEVFEMNDSRLRNLLKNFIMTRQFDKKEQSLIIGVFDSDVSKIEVVNDEETNVYSFKIVPEEISTEFLFDEDEIKSEVDGHRLYIGTEFSKKTKRLIEDSNINIGGDNNTLNKAGRKVIIDESVFDPKCTNLALSKEKFAESIFNDKIGISPESWDNFRHIFEKISFYLQETIGVKSVSNSIKNDVSSEEARVEA